MLGHLIGSRFLVHSGEVIRWANLPIREKDHPRGLGRPLPWCSEEGSTLILDGQSLGEKTHHVDKGLTVRQLLA